jgi:hypothetical protein
VSVHTLSLFTLNETNYRKENTVFTENLRALREVISAECEQRMREEDQLNSRDVAEWLIENHREETISGLADFVSLAMEHRSDEECAQRILRAHTELQGSVPVLRVLAETLGVGLSDLLNLNDEQLESAHYLAALIHSLRTNAALANAQPLGTVLLSQLLTINGEQFESAHYSDVLIHGRRANAAVANAEPLGTVLRDKLNPLEHGNPELTVGEAGRQLRRTVEALRAAEGAHRRQR